MLKWNKHRTILLLIFGSLTLLLAFLTNWIKRAYQEEKSDLHKELMYEFKEVIGSLEDSLVHNVLFNQMIVEVSSFPKKGDFKVTSEISPEANKSIRKTIRIDRSDSVGFAQKGFIGTRAIVDSNFHMLIQTSRDSGGGLQNGSLLPLLFDWESDTSTFMFESFRDDKKIVKTILDRVDDKLQHSELPKSYELLQVPIGSKSKDVLVEFFHMPGHKVAHAALFNDYSSYVLKRITNNILFALMLFGSISLTFFMIYINWRKQQKLIEIKNDFISNVTHELKTPISTVSVALEALSKYDVLSDKKKTQEYLSISQKELGRLKILVDKVLKMSIFEKGASKIYIEKINFNKLIDEVLNSMKIQFEKENTLVNKEVKGEDFTIEADKIHLTNVIYNLLDNAIKYSETDPQIDIKLEESNGHVDLYLKDNGIGIPKADQSKVFQRFYRVPTGDTHNVKGHGLGLSYVSSIIEQHGGKINLESDLEKGSIFHIRLNKSHDKH